LKFLLDHNLPPVWAKGLNEFSANQFDAKAFTQVVALRDKFPHSTPDVEWLKSLGDGLDSSTGVGVAIGDR
jgi:hypothetical protein